MRTRLAAFAAALACTTSLTVAPADDTVTTRGFFDSVCQVWPTLCPA
ncbi:hypothetical protein [Mariniluteicoccus flavus]